MILRRSMLALVVALAAATTAFAAEGDWAMARYDEAQTGFTPQKLSLPLTHCWQHNTTKSAGNPSTPAVVDGVAYFASGNRVYAVDAATGELKWRYPAAEALGFNIKTGITVGEDLLFFGGTDGNLYALNTADGHIMWRYPTSGSIRSTPVVSGGVLFVGSDDNDLYAIDARSGELFWTSGFRTKDDVQSAPAIAPGLVIFASMDANVYAANIARGNMRWRYQLAVSPVRSAPVVAGNLVYVGVGRVIYALSTKNGQLRYSINLPSDVAAPFAVASEGLYVICRNRKMYAYQVGMIGPKAKWTSAVDIGLTVEAPPTVAGNVIYVGCNHGLICAYSTDDGRLLWNYTITPYAGNKDQRVEYTNVTAPLVVANGSLFALTDDGSLHCFTSSAADNTPPKVSDVTPQTGSAMSGQPPISISATLYDESTGVDPNSIELLLDGERVDHTFDPTTLKVSYETPITQPLRAVRDGRHFLTLLAKDWKGNEANYIWSFVVDNTMAPKFTPRIPRKETKQPESTKKGGKKPTNPPTTPKEPGGPSGPVGPGGPSGGPPVPPGGPAAPPGPPAPPSGFDGPPPPNMPGYPAR